MKRCRGFISTVRKYRTVEVKRKLKEPDGKQRETDVADMQGVFRIIQSVTSQKVKSN